MPDKNVNLTKVIGVLIAVCVILILASICFPNVPGPEVWLLEWTNWIAKIAGIVAGTKFLWNGSDAAREYVLDKKAKRLNFPGQ